MGALLIFPPMQRNMAQVLHTDCWCLRCTVTKLLSTTRWVAPSILSFPTWEAEPYGLVWLRGTCYAQAMCLLLSTKVLNMGPYEVAHHRLADFLQSEIQDQQQLHQTSSICPSGTWVERGLGVLLEEGQWKLSSHWGLHLHRHGWSKLSSGLFLH